MYESINARRITGDEVLALLMGETDSIEGYALSRYQQHGDVLVSTTFTRRGRSLPEADALNEARRTANANLPKRRQTYNPAKSCGDEVYRWIDHPDGPTKGVQGQKRTDDLLGYKVSLSTHNVFGMQSGDTAFTTEEARLSYATQPYGHEHGEPDIFVADEAGEPMRLMPIFGSQLTLGLVVEGVEHEDALAQITEDLRVRFGNRVRLHKMLGRPAADVRVDVLKTGLSADEDKMLAVGILDCEASYMQGTGGGYLTREHDRSIVVGR